MHSSASSAPKAPRVNKTRQHTIRRIAPRKKRVYVDPVTNKPLLNSGKLQYAPAVPGSILSSTNSTRRQRLDQTSRLFTKKHQPSFGALSRELRAHRYQRMTFPNLVFTMLCPGKDIPTDVNIFKVPMKMNRMQIKDYLEELYKVRVLKVNTAIFVGKRRIDQYGRYQKLSDWKKAYVRTADPFSFPWPRPRSFPLTPAQRKKNQENEKKRKEEAAANSV